MKHAWGQTVCSGALVFWFFRLDGSLPPPRPTILYPMGRDLPPNSPRMSLKNDPDGFFSGLWSTGPKGFPLICPTVLGIKATRSQKVIRQDLFRARAFGRTEFSKSLVRPQLFSGPSKEPEEAGSNRKQEASGIRSSSPKFLSKVPTSEPKSSRPGRGGKGPVAASRRR